jgi:hypothetical protein
MWLAGIDGVGAPQTPTVSDYADRITMVCAPKESYSIHLNKEIRSIPKKVFRNFLVYTGVRLCPDYRFG